MAGFTNKEVVALLDYNFVMQSKDHILLINKIFNKIKGKNVKTEYLIKDNWFFIYIIFK